MRQRKKLPSSVAVAALGVNVTLKEMRVKFRKKKKERRKMRKEE